jgi:hypothetical protein
MGKFTLGEAQSTVELRLAVVEHDQGQRGRPCWGRNRA